MRKEPEAKQLVCKCGHIEKFPLYVFAHWTERLDFTCPNCGAVWWIQRGKGKMVQGPSKRRGEK